MKGEAFEYAIKKDVRNNPIVREVDEERHREMWRSVIVGIFLVAALVFSVWRQVELFGHGKETVDLRVALKVEEDTSRRLRMEIDTLSDPARIESEARKHLKMVQPGPDDHEVIERVVPSSPPPRTVVAHR